MMALGDAAMVKIFSNKATGFGVSKTLLAKISFNSMDAFLLPSKSVHKSDGRLVLFSK